MIIAQGGADTAQVFTRANPLGPLPGDLDLNMVGLVVQLESLAFIKPAPEIITKYQDAGELFCDEGQWAFFCDEDVITNILASHRIGEDGAIQSVSITELKYARRHENPEIYTITKQTQLCVFVPRISVVGKAGKADKDDPDPEKDADDSESSDEDAFAKTFSRTVSADASAHVAVNSVADIAADWMADMAAGSQ